MKHSSSLKFSVDIISEHLYNFNKRVSLGPSEAMMSKKSNDPNDKYWHEYSNFQRCKHGIIRSYLNGWFPKLGTWAGEIVYIDTHAGRGKHTDGSLGSPLVALNTLLEHSYREQLLRKCIVKFYFIEEKEENFIHLQSRVNDIKNEIPKNIEVYPVQGNSFEILERVGLKTPSFIFIDPFGFKIPGKVIQRLMTFERVELFINIMWRQLNMAIVKRPITPGNELMLNNIFGSNRWISDISSNDINERAQQTATIFKELANAKWETHIFTKQINGNIAYMLLHLSNHYAGRDLMKYCLWDVTPTGDFYIKKYDNPDQEFLFPQEPDLSELNDWILANLRNSKITYLELINKMRDEIWLEKHLTGQLKQLLKQKLICIDGKLNKKANPIISLTQDTLL